jgi:hypothetical protein
MSWFSGLFGPSKEEQEQQLELLKQQMKLGTPVQKKQKEIDYNKLFFKVYPAGITEQAYIEHMNKLNEELAAIKEQEKLPSLFTGWEPVRNEIEMNSYNKKGGKTKSKRTKLKKSNKSKKSKSSKRTKK